MKTTLEKEGKTRVKLQVEVPVEEFAPLLDQTFARLAREATIPGFRKGKAPRRVLEQRLGKDTIRQEFFKEAIPTLYAQALQEEPVEVIGNPEIEVTSFDEGQPLTFTATVEVRPEVQLPQYRGIEVERSVARPTEEDVEKQLEVLRERFGTLESVGRNASDGDYVTIDLSGYRHTQKIDQASAQDLLYEVGSEAIVPELDAEVRGKRAGDILKFNAKLPERFGPPHGGEEISFSVIVKEVQAKKLPELDDEFAKTASEFDTLDQLREDLRERLRQHKEGEADSEAKGRIVEDLVDRTDLEVPTSLVAHETQHRLTRLLSDLQRAGIELDRYLEAAGISQEELVERYRQISEKAAAADLILEAVAEQEKIEVTPSEVDEEIRRLAEGSDQGPEQLRKALEQEGQIGLVEAELKRRKTLDFLVEHAKITEAAE